MGTNGRDLEAWYAALQEKARSVNHTIRVVVTPGNDWEGKTGTGITVVEDHGPLPLPEALKATDEYLSSEKAERRGAQLHELTRALEAVADAKAAVIQASIRKMTAEAAIEAEFKEALREREAVSEKAEDEEWMSANMSPPAPEEEPVRAEARPFA